MNTVSVVQSHTSKKTFSAPSESVVLGGVIGATVAAIVLLVVSKKFFPPTDPSLSSPRKPPSRAKFFRKKILRPPRVSFSPSTPGDGSVVSRRKTPFPLKKDCTFFPIENSLKSRTIPSSGALSSICSGALSDTESVKRIRSVSFTTPSPSQKRTAPIPAPRTSDFCSQASKEEETLSDRIARLVLRWSGLEGYFG